MSRITETINLPSNGRLYSTNKLTIQSMTVAEEKYLYGSSNDKAIDEILNKCIQEDVNLDDLIVPDKHYALVRLRALTYGEDYPVDLRCPRCGKEFTETVKLSTLEVDELPKDFKEPIEITLPVSGDKLKLAIPRSGEINKFNELARRKAEKFDLNPAEVQYIFQTMLGIKSVNDDEMVEDELYTYIEELPAKDSSYIKHEFSKIRVGYYTRLECDCPGCRNKVNFNLPMTSDFFRTKFDD